MKALITKVYPDGSTRLGSADNQITKQYKSFGTLYRYAIRPALRGWCNGRARVEVYHSRNIFGEPDKVFSFNDHIMKVE